MRVLFIPLLVLASGCVSTYHDSTPTHSSSRTDIDLIFASATTTSTESKIPRDELTPPRPQSLPRYLPGYYDDCAWGYGYGYGYSQPYAVPPSYLVRAP
ncbi:MAG: hypothetical protein WA001_05665 [Patescibacteria group bacterium]